jgi:hypothetical protein
MSVGQYALGSLSILLSMGLLGILLYRGHHRTLPIFVLYVAVTTLSSIGVMLHYTIGMWLFHQVVVAAFRLGITLELIRRIFGAFPAAATTARRVMLVILAFTAVTALSVATPDATYLRLHAEVIPRVASAVVWLLTALAVLVLWYRLPLAPLPRAILMGYAPYLLLSTIGLSLLFDERLRPYRVAIGYLTTIASMALTVYWARVAWVTAPDAPPSYRAPDATAPVPRPAS